MIIVKLVSIKRPNASFKPCYHFIKGIFRWLCIPLIYSSFSIYIKYLKDEEYHRDYYASATILIACGVIILVELIATKCYETTDEDSWNKWI